MTGGSHGWCQEEAELNKARKVYRVCDGPWDLS